MDNDVVEKIGIWFLRLVAIGALGISGFGFLKKILKGSGLKWDREVISFRDPKDTLYKRISEFPMSIPSHVFLLLISIFSSAGLFTFDWASWAVVALSLMALALSCYFDAKKYMAEIPSEPSSDQS